MSEDQEGMLDAPKDQLEPYRIASAPPEHPKSDPMAEIMAMTEVAKVLTPLSPESVRRVLSWAADTFRAQVNVRPQSVIASVSGNALSEEMPTTGYAETTTISEEATYDEIGDLFAKAEPKIDAERALLVAYWFQTQGGQSDFDSASVNRELKHMGHGSSNITNALTSLMTRKPQLVIQTRKSGKSQQARKKYKLTNEGVKFARMMLAGEGL